jgi:hypothetical protein
MNKPVKRMPAVLTARVTVLCQRNPRNTSRETQDMHQHCNCWNSPPPAVLPQLLIAHVLVLMLPACA